MLIGASAPTSSSLLLLLLLLILRQLELMIDFIDALEAAADRGQHLLLQAGELLFSIGVIDPAALQRPLIGMTQQALHRLERGFQQQKWILLRGAKTCSH